MRIWLFILTNLLWLSAATVCAEEALLGTVEAIDRDKGELILRVTDSSADRGHKISVFLDPENMPCCIGIGKTVRVWGSYAKGNSSTFQAVTVRGNSFQGNGHDPTGVRCRIGRGRGHGRGGAGHR
ncbi:MAG: hypothetical protein R2941_02375 [Desulfobacterales bacterium]